MKKKSKYPNIFLVRASGGRYNGSAIFNAKNKREARQNAYTYWLDFGKVYSVITLEDEALEWGYDDVEEYLKEEGLSIDLKEGEWYELDWGT